MSIDFSTMATKELRQIAVLLNELIQAEREKATEIGSFCCGIPPKHGYSKSKVEDCVVQIADLEQLYRNAVMEIRRKGEAA